MLPFLLVTLYLLLVPPVGVFLHGVIAAVTQERTDTKAIRLARRAVKPMQGTIAFWALFWPVTLVICYAAILTVGYSLTVQGSKA